MGIELRWETVHERRVLVYEFKEGWKWHDFDAVKLEADDWLEQSETTIPLIFDFTDGNEMLPFMMQNTRNMARTRHPYGTPVLIVGANQLIQTTYNVVKRLLGRRSAKLTRDVVFLKTWDDVRAHIAAMAGEYPNQIDG